MQNNLKKAREALGLTQAETARAAGIPLRSYQSYEASERLPGVYALLMIAKALKTTAENLFVIEE
jgi:transcriptional regulator with XRE-family HTH domain